MNILIVIKVFISTSPLVVVITNVFQTTFETEQITLQYGQMITTEKNLFM